MRLQSDSDNKYLTVMFYAAVAELDTTEESTHLRIVVHLIQFSSYKGRVDGAVLEIADGLNARADASMSVRFLVEIANLETDWQGLVVAPMPWATVTSTASSSPARASTGD
jgi:hypothetical protein